MSTFMKVDFGADETGWGGMNMHGAHLPQGNSAGAKPMYAP